MPNLVVLEEGLGFGGGCKLRQYAKNLTTSHSADVDVVAEDGAVCGRDGEGHLGKCGVERLDADDSVRLILQAESAQKASDLEFRVGRPHTNVVTVLVGEARALDVCLLDDGSPLIAGTTTR